MGAGQGHEAKNQLHLDYSFKQLKSLKDVDFKAYSRLITLKLRSNDLSDVNGLERLAETLQELDIGQNNIQILTPSILSLTKLTKLKVT
jgi:Leucine-rich repeat (LRR) protein